MSLFNKYRPATLDKVVGGYDKFMSVDTHTYLFQGSSGSGKSSLSHAFALSVTDESNIVYSNASNENGVDDARRLIEMSYLQPLSGSWVFIIDEIQKASGAYFDCMLNSWEFPPKYVYWILCTSEPAKIPETVFSRCRIVQFNPHSPENIMAILDEINTKENAGIKRSILAEIADNCNGNARTAINTLESVISNPAMANQIVDNINRTEMGEDVYEVVKAYFSKDWYNFSSKFNQFKKSNKLESIRIGILSYGTTILLKNHDINLVKRLSYLSEPWYGNDAFSKAVINAAKGF